MTPQHPKGEGRWQPIDADRPRIIVNAAPDDYVLVGRVVRAVTDPAYVWPEDGITFLTFGPIDGRGRNFGVRRNKSSITIYGPSHAAPAGEA